MTKLIAWTALAYATLSNCGLMTFIVIFCTVFAAVSEPALAHFDHGEHHCHMDQDDAQRCH